MLGIILGSDFASRLPELSLPWEAARPESPKLLVLNVPLATELGLDPEQLRTGAGIRLLLGNDLPENATPVAQGYSGHQFGAYSPRLGDGRALLLGELDDARGAQRDLHLKGSGRTPFSRGADGFAAVGPMLREYLVSEAMHALGVPTTRSLAVVGTGQRVLREEALDPLPGALLVRVASSHLRVGSFQYALSLGEPGLMQRLADFAIERHYPHLAENEVRYLGLLDAVITAQARLVASWMLVGFVHGVMNTDNMTISGETIDYGPCAFIDAYDPAAVFSSIDHGGRYSYRNQPAIALWNLTRFAETLLPLIADEASTGLEAAKEIALGALGTFEEQYRVAWADGMRVKLGIAADAADDDTVQELGEGMLRDLETHRADFTLAFRALATDARQRDPKRVHAFSELLGTEPGSWFATWQGLSPDPAAMDAVNPLVIPRNATVDEALEAASNGNLEPFEQLLAAVTEPYMVRAGSEQFAEAPALGARRHITYCGT